ncbi:hydrogenase formation protein HypD [Sporanaerobium hydrogeniformans]|uniref:Hydrogenase formation protein HypD n=1 Tax=Sporanaerobium hydrogeniformans TaxID=3072179 RepID=A0AC61DEZ6_9FIRM|nr:hydrogenase formation protein HypD [Sporanaerobium hydrogeniformans]PHV71864.1 hydrogenase formation protein HypD [Sporanaerobium hydrogeniformans]
MRLGEELLEDATRSKVIDYISHYEGPKIRIMEVCGSHTKAISEYGLTQILPPTMELVSGPGCPICVTPDAYLIDIRSYCQDEKNIIVCFGDLLRLPQMQGINRKRVRMIYSSLECLKIAAAYPDKQVIFIAIAFETTAPLIAWVIKKAKALNLLNLKVWCGLKRMIPVLNWISNQENIQGYLYPGHVAVILGEKIFTQISIDYGIPGVIAGFKMDELLVALARLIALCVEGKATCTNEYGNVVSSEGNILAQNQMREVFETRESLWRGIGKVPFSGYGMKEAYKNFEIIPSNEETGDSYNKMGLCLCGLVVRGRKKPQECPLWGESCTPMHPQGACMVTVEGACAIAYHFKEGGKNEESY